MKRRLKGMFARRQRIYCFPNRFGFAGFALFLVMLAVGASYQNNLIFMMAFLIISISLVAILQTARNIRDIELLAVTVHSHFASQATTVKLSLINRGKDIKTSIEGYAEFVSEKGHISVRIPFEWAVLEKESTSTNQFHFQLPGQRGRYLLRRLQIGTVAPYGLFRAWIYLKADAEFVVYPELNGTRELPQSPLHQGENFSGHRKYVAGDPISRLDWKVYSRRRQHFIKEFHESDAAKIELRLQSESEKPVEAQLSQLSLWIDEAFQKQVEFRLEAGRFSSRYGSDKSHYHRCLTELALWAS